jgi:hypothetical protein
MGSDYYSTHFFIEKILGRPDGIEWSIDVYQAVEMGICGLLAHRSILQGSAPQKVPNFRIKEERDAYRDDRDTTFPDLENGHLVPMTGRPLRCTPDSTYFDYVRSLWEDGAKLMEEYPF